MTPYSEIVDPAKAAWGPASNSKEWPGNENAIFGALVLVIEELRGLRQDVTRLFDPEAKAAAERQRARDAKWKRYDQLAPIERALTADLREEYAEAGIPREWLKSLDKTTLRPHARWMRELLHAWRFSYKHLPGGYGFVGTDEEYKAALLAAIAAHPAPKPPLQQIREWVGEAVANKPHGKKAAAYRAILAMREADLSIPPAG